MSKKQTNSKHLAIRFLKSGFFPVQSTDIPDIESMTPEKLSLWATGYLGEQTDEMIYAAMHDFKTSVAHGKTHTFFDEITAEAVQNPKKFDTAEENIYASSLWDFYTDPEYAENIVYENKQMGQYLENLGFTQDNVTSIASGAPSSISKLDKLKTLDSAHSAALADFRQEYGILAIEKINNDDHAPKLLKELIKECNITYLGFEKIVASSDYMPDHCVYLYLSGDILIGVQTEDKSESWDDTEHEYGDQEIIEEIHFHDVVNDNGLIARQATMEEGVNAYKYLMKLLDGLESENREVFRDYLLEREN